jgi:GTP1/Obg family GTP-binding protein
LAYAEPPTEATEGKAAAPQTGEAPAANVTDDKLENFVDAATEVQNVQTTYTERMKQAADQQQAQSLRQEAQDKMVSAVEESGLTVQEYNLIAQRLQTDPALAERMKSLQTGG